MWHYCTLVGSSQPIKFQLEWFIIVSKLSANQLAAWVIYHCLIAVSQSNSSLRDLSLFDSSQPIKFQLAWFIIVWKLSAKQIPACVIFHCLKAISESACSLHDLPFVIYPCSIFSVPNTYRKHTRKSVDRMKVLNRQLG